MILYLSTEYQNPQNAKYPFPAEIQTEELLKSAVANDHVAAAYKDNHRSNDNFLYSDCLMMDVDNAPAKGQPDIPPGEWVDLDRIRADLPGVEFYAATSRNHMKPKDGRPPRPRYHVYFPISRIDDVELYSNLKDRLKEKFPYYDANATDGARFFYGNRDAQVTYFPGNRTIYDFIIDLPPQPREMPPDPRPERTNFAGSAPAFGWNEQGYDLHLVLDYIDPTQLDYLDWVKTGMSLHKLSDQFSFSDWETWSRRDQRFKPNDCRRRWNGFKRDSSGVGAKFLIQLAKSQGWQPPERPQEHRQDHRSVEHTEPKFIDAPPPPPPEPRYSGVELVDQFVDIVKTRTFEPIPSGIPDLDRALDGGFTRDSVIIINAAPGMGKSALASQIVEYLARGNDEREGYDVVYFNLEMSRETMLARSIARTAYDLGYKGITTNRVLRGYEWGEDTNKIEQSIERYKNTVAKHLVYNPGKNTTDLNTIMRKIDREAEHLGHAPIVALDYCQLVTGQPGEDAISAIRNTMLSLENYASENHTLVFAISANNRESMKSGRSDMFSGRDSSNLEFGASLLLGIEYAALTKRLKTDDWTNIDKAEESIKKNPLDEGKSLDFLNALKQAYRETVRKNSYDSVEKWSPKDRTIHDLYMKYCTRVTIRINKNRFGVSNDNVVLHFDGATSRFYGISDRESPMYAPKGGRNRRGGIGGF